MKTSILEYLEGRNILIKQLLQMRIHPVRSANLRILPEEQELHWRNILLREIRFRYLWKRV